MAFYQLIKTQKLPISKEEAWNFISSPNNLKEITPKSMGFLVTSKYNTEKMYAGMIISYIVKPILNIPTTWVTEITHVKELSYFVDEQRIGPYKMWHHQHKLETIENGVLMTDIVTYQPPLGLLGAIANTIFIKKQLNHIFRYRFQVLEEKFGKY